MAERGIIYTNILVCEAVGDNPGHQSDPGVATTGGGGGGGEAIFTLWLVNVAQQHNHFNSVLEHCLLG